MLTAEQNRAKAAEYTELLKAASLPAEVHEFQRLERSYLMLAENEEWMAGNHDKINIRGADENSYGNSVPASDGSGEPGLSYVGMVRVLRAQRHTEGIIAKLNGAMVEALADPAVRKRFADLGLDVAPREPEQTPGGISPHSKRLDRKVVADHQGRWDWGAGAVNGSTSVRLVVCRTPRFGPWPCDTAREKRMLAAPARH